MRNKLARRSTAGFTLTLIVMLLTAASSNANGPCGQDFDGNHACPVNSPGSYDGSLTTDNERDYYVFRAQKGTELGVSITDTENPQCSTASYGECGRVDVELLNASGESEDENAGSNPYNGITVPGKFSHTIETTGTYYLVVSGNLGRDEHENPAPVPYALEVSASPNVVWPPPTVTPAPPATTHTETRCTVKHVRRHRHHHWKRVRVRVCRTVTVPG